MGSRVAVTKELYREILNEVKKSGWRTKNTFGFATVLLQEELARRKARRAPEKKLFGNGIYYIRFLHFLDVIILRCGILFLSEPPLSANG